MECVSAQARMRHPLRQLGSSLMSVTDKQYPLRTDVFFLNKILHLANYRRRLATTGAAHHQAILFLRHNRTPLLVVERICKNGVEKSLMLPQFVVFKAIVVSIHNAVEILKIILEFCYGRIVRHQNPASSFNITHPIINIKHRRLQLFTQDGVNISSRVLTVYILLQIRNMQPLCHNFCYGFLTAGMHLSENHQCGKHRQHHRQSNQHRQEVLIYSKCKINLSYPFFQLYALSLYKHRRQKKIYQYGWNRKDQRGASA